MRIIALTLALLLSFTLDGHSAMSQPHWSDVLSGKVFPPECDLQINPDIVHACTALSEVNRAIAILDARCTPIACSSADADALIAAQQLRVGLLIKLGELTGALRYSP